MPPRFQELCRPASLGELAVIRSLLDGLDVTYYVVNEDLFFAGTSILSMSDNDIRVMVASDGIEDARALLDAVIVELD